MATYRDAVQACDDLDSAIDAFLKADLPLPAKTIGDLLQPGLVDLVKAANQGATLQRSLWRARNGRNRIIGSDGFQN